MKTVEKVSLIMTTYNCREHFEKSIRSALLQDYPNLEIVIVDGGSTDGTVEIIQYHAENNADKTKKIVWKSEPDKGIYDGMNKGILMSTGEVIAVFNDLFTCNDAISKMMRVLQEGNCQGVHADLAYMDGDVCKRLWHMGQGNIHTGWMPAHPTLYLRREIYESYGLYDLKYQSSSDYEFMVRILKNGKVRLAYLPEVMIHMFYGGTSNNGIKGYPRNIWEAYKILLHHHILFPMTAILLRVIRTMKQYRKSVSYNG